MQGDEDILGDADPNLTFDLEDINLESASEAGKVVGGVAHQKPVRVHRTRHGVRRGQEIPLISKLRLWIPIERRGLISGF